MMTNDWSYTRTIVMDVTLASEPTPIFQLFGRSIIADTWQS
jgi:hypothetical protein